MPETKPPTLARELAEFTAGLRVEDVPAAAYARAKLHVLDALGTALANTDMTIETTAAGSGGLGDIFVNDAVTWTTNKTLTLNAYRDINITKARGSRV